MGMSSHLQHLDFFIVGKHKENGIKELGTLSNLHGSLSIRNLENVTRSNEALEARMMDKKKINSLLLEWSNGTDFQIELDVLCKLKPHQGLESLSILGYNGTIFPDWVGNFSYHNMTYLRLRDCNTCCVLPSLGQLPSLKRLYISKLNSVKRVDAGFYKNEDRPSVTPFSSLETLEIDDMCCWELWSTPESDAFPLLKCLRIRNCPKLRGDLPNHLPTLKTLEIRNWSESVKCLNSFQIYKCPNFVSFSGEGLPAPNLTHFVVSHCYKLKSLPDQMSTLLPKLKYLGISNCPEIESFPEGGMPPNLTSVTIWNCEKLLSGLAWPSMDKLTHLTVCGPCHGIKSFPKEGLLPASLTSLTLEDFSSLEMLDCKGLLHLTSLQELEIVECGKLENMVGESLPDSLIKLTIRECPLLGKRCCMKHPQIWPKISHIRGIMVDDRWI